MNMLEIKIKRKKSVWPLTLLGLIVAALFVYLWNKKKKGELMEGSKELRESSIYQSTEMMIPVSKELYFLSDLTDYELAKNYTDVRGWVVWDSENHLIGTADDFLVNKEVKTVAYLIVKVDASVIATGITQGLFYDVADASKVQNRAGDDHLFIPVEKVISDNDNKILIINQISYESIVRARRFSRSARTMPAYPVDQFRA
jgi:hypothetical protein